MGEDTAREGGQATVGILLLDTKFPRVVGDGGNADTWPFPVLIEKVRGATPHQVVDMRLEGLLEPFVEGAKSLVAKGADGITTTCPASSPSTSASWPSARACPWPPRPSSKCPGSRPCCRRAGAPASSPPIPRT